MISVRGFATVLAACSLVLLLVARATGDVSESNTKDSSVSKWDVSIPHVPSDTIEFEATEVTWITVDVSPDGKEIVFDILGDIYKMPIAGGDATLLSGGLPYEVQPRFSPDGKKILFTSDRGGGDNIWMMNADG
ncbi:MAG: amidohydrolase, partial [Candidatus Zixiibacteriota bacterium]